MKPEMQFITGCCLEQRIWARINMFWSRTPKNVPMHSICICRRILQTSKPLNGDQRQTANLTDYRQNEKKNNDYTDSNKTSRLPTWSNIVQIFVFRNKPGFFLICLLFLFLVNNILLDLFPAQGRSFSQLYFRPEVTDFKFQFQYLQNFLSLNYFYEIVMKTKSCRHILNSVSRILQC